MVCPMNFLSLGCLLVTRRLEPVQYMSTPDRIIKWLDQKSLKLVLRIYSKLKHTHTHAHAHTHRDRHRHTHTHTHTQTHTHTHTRARTHSQTFGLVLCCRWNRVCVGALGALEKNSSSADGFAVWKSIHVKIVVSSDHFKSLQKLWIRIRIIDVHPRAIPLPFCFI